MRTHVGRILHTCAILSLSVVGEEGLAPALAQRALRVLLLGGPRTAAAADTA